MEIFIRLENEEDYYIVENLTREAFWQPDKKPVGCDEHYLVNKLRQSSDFILVKYPYQFLRSGVS